MSTAGALLAAFISPQGSARSLMKVTAAGVSGPRASATGIIGAVRQAPEPGELARKRQLRARRRRQRQRSWSLVALVLVGTVGLLFGPAMSRSLPGQTVGAPARAGRLAPLTQALRRDVTEAAAISGLRGKIVAIAESQLGYRTDPPNTYCNKYSAYWVSGTNDCGNSNLDEQWCADFAAWVWQGAGTEVTYQFINGDLNSSSASFYEWGVARGTWHPVGSGYVPLPGDVAVYGLNVPALVAQHVAIVISFSAGDQGPNTINGDGDRTGFSAVDIGIDQYQADVPGPAPAVLSGYVSPS